MTDVPSIEMEPTKRPVWVRERRSVYFRWSAAAFGEFALLVALISAAVHFSGSSSPTLVVWLLAVAYFLVASLGVAVMMSGLSSMRLSRFVRAVEVPGVGRGLSVPERGGFLMRAFLLVFAALLGALAVVSRNDEPGPRQFKFEWLTVVGAPICLALFVLGFVVVNRTRVSLHPEGIAQEVFRRRGWKVTSDIILVRWDDVADLRLEAHPNPAVPNRHAMPVIRVVRRSVEPAMFIMACEKKVEPNALLALMQWCRGNPWARAQLGADNARELLRPPSLRDRIRADRAAS